MKRRLFAFAVVTAASLASCGPLPPARDVGQATAQGVDTARQILDVIAAILRVLLAEVPARDPIARARVEALLVDVTAAVERGDDAAAEEAIAELGRIAERLREADGGLRHAH